MSSYSKGQTHQLMNALEAAEFTPGDITRLGQFDKLGSIRDLLYGTHEIRLIRHIIDCDADPYLLEGWEVVEHRKHGELEWDPSKVTFYLSPNQMSGKHIGGNKLRKELADKPTLNANVLDYLLANPYLIPEEWKYKYVFFWGTIYRDSGGYLCVRYLHWNGDGWHWYRRWLGRVWFLNFPAALLAP